jgi:hypothetical protein
MVVIIPDDWYTALAQVEADLLSRAMKVFVIGPKGAGKSSFIRFLQKRLVEKLPCISTLDIDPGQPEHTAPGIMSLYNTRSSEGLVHSIVSQRFLGIVSPATEPFSYVETSRKVYLDYKTYHSQHPLLINTHGWTSGTGRTTIEAMMLLIQPDIVIHVGCESDDPVFEVNPVNSLLPESEYIVPSCRSVGVSKVALLHEPYPAPKPVDSRWIKYASHFRPDLVARDVFKSCHLREFFRAPYVRFIMLDKGSFGMHFPALDEFPKNPYYAIELTLVGLSNSESGQLYCLGFVMSVEGDSVRIAIPPNIPECYGPFINQIVRGDMSWSPRDQVHHKGKTTSTDFNDTDEPFYLLNVLVGDGTGARTPSTRTNLRRKRLV